MKFSRLKLKEMREVVEKREKVGERESIVERENKREEGKMF